MRGLALAPALALAAACPPPGAANCPEKLVILVEGVVCESPCTIDFGTVTVALQEQRLVSFEGVTAACGFVEFFLDEAETDEAFRVTPGFSPPFARVQFVPDEEGAFEGTLRYSGDIGNGEFVDDSIALAGTGAAP